MPHALAASFLFLFGACVGSFLNVVAHRLPMGKSVVWPPSACPKCGHRLAARDNIPVLGWVLLRGKCRYCGNPIGARYPIVELACGLLFAGLYAALFVFDLGPCGPEIDAEVNRFGFAPPVTDGWHLARDAHVLAIYLVLAATLLVSSLIDADYFIIPRRLPWIAAVVAVVLHVAFDRPEVRGNLLVGPVAAGAALAAWVGVLASNLLLRAGVFPLSFADGGPALEHESHADAPPEELPDYPPAKVRREIMKEVLFLAPPIALWAGAALVLERHAPAFLSARPVLAFGGCLVGALVGAGLVWLTRVLGSLGFGREAMGLGDVHLMVGIGAALGGLGATATFFLAPFAGLAVSLYLLLFSKRRQIPYGPYLSVAAVAAILLACPIQRHVGQGLAGLGLMVRDLLP